MEGIKSLDEVHPVGTFVQIHEMQDMGDRLRMIVLAHRRIRATGVIHDVDDQDVVMRRGRLTNRKKKPSSATEETSSNEEHSSSSSSTESETAPSTEKTTSAKDQVLMVETENLPVPQFKMTNEIKALTAEVVKTIRDIISMNPLYRESLMQMIQSGQRVTDNPIYLADLGAALTGAETAELQVRLVPLWLEQGRAGDSSVVMGVVHNRQPNEP